MKLIDIKKGGKYYHSIATNSKCKLTLRKVKETKTVRVVEVDVCGKKVCASINGAPAQWYGGRMYNRWSVNQDAEKTF